MTFNADDLKARLTRHQKGHSLAELCDYLRVLDLPGVAPPEFGTLDPEVHDHGTYIQRE